MGYQLFYYEDTQLPTEARWFLWQWERYTGLHVPIDATVNTLLAQLKMPLRQGQKTLLELKKAGIIEATPVAKGRGRPSYRYRVAPTLLATLKALPSEEISLSDCIEYISQYDPLAVSVPAKAPPQDVAKVTASSASHEEAPAHAESSLQGLSGDDKEQAKLPLSVSQPNLHHSHRRKEQLTRANRWLLMVLLARSEVPGIVTDLSRITLQRLTGMSTSQLASQLKKLKTLGVIANHQPGQAGKLLGKLMTSIYQLDLSHPLLGHPDRKSTSLNFPISSTDSATELNYGIIDSLMAYGVSLRYGKILSSKIENIETTISSELQPNQVATHAYAPHLLELRKQLKESLNESNNARSYAEGLLPALHHLYPTIKSLVRKCNTSQLDWLRAHIHAETMRMLSTQWKYLRDNEILPNAPNAKEDPEAALRHQLAHHLAMNLKRQLKIFSEKHNDIEFELLNYTFTPLYSSNGRQLAGLALQCFAFKTNGVGYLPNTVVTGTSILFSLKRYWEKHRPKVIPASLR